MKSKYISLLLVIALLSVLFTGCGDTDEKDAETLPQVDLNLPTSTEPVTEVYNPDGTITSQPDPSTDPSSEPTSDPSTETPPSSELKSAMATAGVNMRKEGSTSASIIMKLPKGALVQLLDVSDSSWYKVKFGDKTGFVSSEYLDSNTTETEMKLQAKITTRSLNVRSAASSDGNVLGTLGPNDKVTVVGVDGDWFKIKYDDSFGFVSSQYIEFVS